MASALLVPVVSRAEDDPLRWVEPDNEETEKWRAEKQVQTDAYLADYPHRDHVIEVYTGIRKAQQRAANLMASAGGTQVWLERVADPANDAEPDRRLHNWSHTVWVVRDGETTELETAHPDWLSCRSSLAPDGNALIFGERPYPEDRTDPPKKWPHCAYSVYDLETGEHTELTNAEDWTAHFTRDGRIRVTDRSKRRPRIRYSTASGDVVEDWSTMTRGWGDSEVDGGEAFWTRRGRKWTLDTVRIDGTDFGIDRKKVQLLGFHEGNVLLYTLRHKEDPRRLLSVDPRTGEETELFEEPLPTRLALNYKQGTLLGIATFDGVSRIQELGMDGEVLREPDDRAFASGRMIRNLGGRPRLRMHDGNSTIELLRSDDGTYEEIAFQAPFSETELTSIEARSGDGTMIPVSVSFPEGFEKDGNRPVWLKAYGGFGSSSLHYLNTADRIWLQSGGIVATVHARGGRERGKEWHEAATKEHLGKTFDDVIAAAEWFVDEGWSKPGRIAISGASNGGLTSMASVSRRPDLFGAAISGAGVHDLIRGPELPGHWWGKEYGRDGTLDRSIREQNSPVHAKPDTLPPLFIHTGIEDPTVPPAHSYRLVEAWSEIEGGPVLLRIWPWASHMWHYPQKKRREKAKEFTPETMQAQQIEPLLFLLRALDVDASETFVPER